MKGDTRTLAKILDIEAKPDIEGVQTELEYEDKNNELL